MNIVSECIWKKYDDKLAEIEKRLAGRKFPAGSQEQPRAERAVVAPTIQEIDLSHAEARIANIIAENNRLKEETKFLKLENNVSINLKEEISRLKYEFERVSRERETEISTLYARNKRLETEAAKLAMDKRRIELKNNNLSHSFSVTGSNRSTSAVLPDINNIENRTITVEKPGRAGILQWLSKPLLVVKTG
jgi:hypothetical protein